MEVIRNLPDNELVSNLQSGTRLDETIRCIYRDYFNGLSWYVINNSGNQQDAEDIFQEVVVTFIDLVQKNKFRGESSVRTFLFSLNRHAWLNELKKRGRTLAREEKFEKTQDRQECDVSEVISEREGRSHVLSVLQKLGDTCQKILVLFYYEERSIKEILTTLHYENEQVVRNKKHKCLKKLEEMINENPSLKQSLKNVLNG